jgi:hypothetical protein
VNTSGPTIWHSLAGQIERRGATAILTDIENADYELAAAIDHVIGCMSALPTDTDLQLGTNPTNLIIRLTNELRDARASMCRAVEIARTLVWEAASPKNGRTTAI